MDPMWTNGMCWCLRARDSYQFATFWLQLTEPAHEFFKMCEPLDVFGGDRTVGIVTDVCLVIVQIGVEEAGVFLKDENALVD